MTAPDQPRCIYCRRLIWRQRNQGAWYHRRTASASCYPGSGSWKRATPPEVSA